MTRVGRFLFWLLVGLLLAAALSAPAAVAHDEGQLARIYNHCWNNAAHAGPPKNQNTVLQQCLRLLFSSAVCRHNDDAGNHTAQHLARAHRQCNEAAAAICHPQRVRQTDKCEARVSHDCLKTEDLCVQRAHGGNPSPAPAPAFSSLQ